MLVHHADAGGVGVVGVFDQEGLSVLPDLARVRLVQAEQHAHQRRLARAVFAQQRVDLAPDQPERDVVVGAYAGEVLGDADHLDDIIQDNHSTGSDRCVKIQMQGRIGR